ncbi:PD40 domain-containing protein [bacterium]|nr:PD40 domain-containing protein [bacterium]
MNAFTRAVSCAVFLGLLCCCDKGNVNGPDDDPLPNPGPDPVPATITISHFPDIVSPETEMTFSISGLPDSVSLDSLSVRWDWSSDGAWDTDSLVLDDIDHAYPDHGTYIVSASIRNTQGSELTVLDTVHVVELLTITQNSGGFLWGNVDWAPDGTNRIAFDMSGQNINIFIAGYPGGTPEQVTFNPAPDTLEGHQFAQWSPDGKKLLFQASGTHLGYITQVRQLDLETRTVTTIFEMQSPGINTLWSQDGQSILYAENKSLKLFSFADSSVTDLTSGVTVWGYCFSPASDRIAYFLMNEKNTTLRIMDVQTQTDIKTFDITGAGAGSKLDWSPDGNWICLGFVCDEVTDERTLHVLNYHSGNIYSIRLCQLSECWYPTWSSDSSILAFEAKEGDNPLEIWGITFPQDIE